MNRRKFLKGIGCAVAGILAPKAKEAGSVAAPQDEAQFVAIPKTQFYDDGEWRDVFYRKPRVITGYASTVTTRNAEGQWCELTSGEIVPSDLEIQDAYDALAKSLGGTVKQLTVQEKSAAFLGAAKLERMDARGQWVEVGTVHNPWASLDG